MLCPSPVSWCLPREVLNSPASTVSNPSNDEETHLNHLRQFATPIRSRNLSREQPAETTMKRARVSVRTRSDDTPVIVKR